MIWFVVLFLLIQSDFRRIAYAAFLYVFLNPKTVGEEKKIRLEAESLFHNITTCIIALRERKNKNFTEKERHVWKIYNT